MRLGIVMFGTVILLLLWAGGEAEAQVDYSMAVEHDRIRLLENGTGESNQTLYLTNFCAHTLTIELTVEHGSPVVNVTPVVRTVTLGSGGDGQYNYSIESENANISNVEVIINGRVTHVDGATSPEPYERSDTFIVRKPASFDSDGSPLIYSTYVGGEDRDRGYSMAVDDDGYVYVTGYTRSADFPITEGAFNDTLNGYRDVYVAKLSPDGSDLIYSTYVGGSSYDDIGSGICVDNEGSVYVAGYTASDDFPTTPGAYDREYNGGEVDGFIFKLSPDGSTLEYSTYIGGSAIDGIRDIAIDNNKNVTVIGITNSTNFPTSTTAKDRSHNGLFDAFVLRLSDKGTQLMASTYLGGTNNDEAYAIALDDDGHAYVTGYTESTNFPKTNGVFDRTHNGETDIFVTKVSHSGTTFQYSTFVGGTYWEEAYDIVLDDEEYAYVTGFTDSYDFPTTDGAYNRSKNGWWEDMFVFQLSPSGTYLKFSTYIGGEDEDYGMSLDVDVDGSVYAVGRTSSRDFPTTPDTYNQSTGGNIILFMLKENGTELAYSSALGGWEVTYVYDIVHSGNGNCYVTGYTYSGFPVTDGAYDETHNMDSDIYVFKMKVTINTPLIASIRSISPAAPNVGDAVSFNGSGEDSDGYITAYQWHSSIDGNLSTNVSFTTSTLSPGEHLITFRVMDNRSYWSENVSQLLNVNLVPTAHIQLMTPAYQLQGKTVYFRGSGNDTDGSVEGYQWVSSIDGTISSKMTFSKTTLSNGTHTISFRVQDDDGAWSSWANASLNILNPGEAPPVASIISITPTSLKAGELVSFQGKGVHAYWNVTHFAWHSDIQGSLDRNETFHTDELVPGTHTISFKVTDEMGEESVEATAIVVVRAPEGQEDDDDGLPLFLIIGVVVVLVGAVGGFMAYKQRQGGTPAVPAGKAQAPAAKAPAPAPAPAPPSPEAAYQPPAKAPAPEPQKPPAPETVTIQCPSCQGRMRIPKLGRLQQIKCEACGLEGELEV